MKKKIRIACLVLILLFCTTMTSIASSLIGIDPNTMTSGWLFAISDGHIGSQYLTYGFEDTVEEGMYNSYFDAAQVLWGNNIYIANTGIFGSICTVTASSGKYYDAKTTINSINSNTGHVTSATIDIGEDYFIYSINSEAGRAKTIAHELGHVYGLDDLYYDIFSNQIMYGYYNENKSVTSNDIHGIQVMTHVHTHGSGTTGTYILHTNNDVYHQVICNYCKAIVWQTHSFISGYCTKCGYSDQGEYSIENPTENQLIPLHEQ